MPIFQRCIVMIAMICDSIPRPISPMTQIPFDQQLQRHEILGSSRKTSVSLSYLTCPLPTAVEFASGGARTLPAAAERPKLSFGFCRMLEAWAAVDILWVSSM